MKRLLFGLLSIYKRLTSLSLRLRGKTRAESAAARVRSGRTWDEFCDALKAAGASLTLPGAPRDAASQAEGYRYLTRLLRGGLEAFLEHGDPVRPELRRTVSETIKIGADNPDNAYYNAAVSGAYRYLISGTRGTVKRLSFHMQRGSYGSSGGLQPAGKLEAADLVTDGNGRFEIHASVARPPEAVNWLPMTSDTTLFMVRQTFGDRFVETEAEVSIRCLDNVEPRRLTPEVLDTALTQTAAFVAGTSAIFSRWAVGFKKHPNTLPRFSDAVSTAAGGDPRIAYYHSYWRLAEDEALVIHTPVPDCEYWNFQVNNIWMESLDYRYNRIHINGENAELNSDGTVTIVVSQRDPGVPNHLTTDGRRFGTMCFRWVGAQDPIEPETRVVKVDSLGRG